MLPPPVRTMFPRRTWRRSGSHALSADEISAGIVLGRLAFPALRKRMIDTVSESFSCNLGGGGGSTYDKLLRVRKVHLAHRKAFGAEVEVVARRELVVSRSPLHSSPTKLSEHTHYDSNERMETQTARSSHGQGHLRRFASILRSPSPRTTNATSLLRLGRGLHVE